MKNIPLLFVIGLLLGACHLTDQGSPPDYRERIVIETEYIFGGDGIYHPMDVSPDDQKILVNFRSQTGIFDIRSGSMKMLTSGSTMYNPVAFSPDGSRILYTSGHRMQTMDTTGTDHRRLVPVGTDSLPKDPVGFSPDGEQVLFNMIVNFSGEGRRIFVTDPEGGMPQQLTDMHSEAFDFSPDGQKILFMQLTDGEKSVWIMDADGSNRKRISEEGINAYPVQFSGNSRYILYTRYDGGDQIMVSDTAGTVKRTVAEGSLLVPVAISPAGGTVAYYEGSGFGICGHCSAVRMYLIGSGGLRKTEIKTGYFQPGPNIRFLSDGKTFIHSATYNGTTRLMLSVMDPEAVALFDGQ